jgi:hypothetical protein
MEEIIKFKKSFLKGSFIEFFDKFNTENKAKKLEFIIYLKKINLDLIFYQGLKKIKKENHLDDELLNLLKQEFLLEKGRDEFYKNQFQAIVNKTHFPILLLKGWRLRQIIGFDLYKRSCDVDLLVSEKDFKTAISFLKRDFNFFKKSEYIAYGQQCLLNENSMCIDLHKKLIAFQTFDTFFNLSAKELLKESYLEEREPNVSYYVFNLEMELIHLCIHFLLHHEGYGFILVYELKCLLNNHLLNINKDKFISLTEKHNCLFIVIYSLLIVQELCKLDDAVKNWIIKFVKEFDLDLQIRKSFNKEFSEHSFYKNKGISNEVLEKLLINNYKDKISFIKADINFKTYCFFKSLGETLKIV